MNHVVTDALICLVEQSSTKVFQRSEVQRSEVRSSLKTKTGLVGPVSKRRVEMRLHRHTTRTGNKSPRVSLTTKITGLSYQGKAIGDGKNMP
jgi:hypothetical protein